ncbi:ubiquitin-specific protease ESD4 [Trifolium repens]|nr:ubiquitin-specific protease ESD4 [Trifolium repens]
MIEVGASTKPRTDSPRPTTENTTEKRGEVSNPVITIEDEKEEEQDPSRSKGKRKAVESDYESELDKDKEVANTDLVFSDGDYEFHADDVNKKICQTINNLNMQIKQAAPKPLLPDAWTSIDNLGKSADLSNPMRFSNSNCRRDSKNRTMEEDLEALNGISKKLFTSPFTTPPTSSKGKRVSSSNNGKKTLTGSVSKRCKSVLPKGIKWNFPVTSDMKLDFAELQAIAYVYHPDKDKSGIEAYRADFDTLTPGNMINHKIVTLVCLTSTWMQESYNRGAVWFLPPAFADDIFLGKTIEELIATYCKDWMPSYPRLKYIYVPINTSSDHWFLMVISMQLQTIYHLDSYCGIGDVKPRRATISIISRTLERMVSAALYGTTFLGRSTEFNEWPIEEAHGIPNCGHSNNADVWVIDWMDMDQCFTPNIQGELKENMIRVKTASNLVLGVYNDLWDFIEEEAKNFWALISN